MKQTSKQKKDEIKKQVNVTNGVNKDMFKNGKLKLPNNKKMQSDSKITTAEKKPTPKPEVTVASFLSFLKENVKEFSTEHSTDGYEKVKINKKVYSYIKDGKRKSGVIVWNQIESKTEFIGNKKDMEKQLQNISDYIKK